MIVDGAVRCPKPSLYFHVIGWIVVHCDIAVIVITIHANDSCIARGTGSVENLHKSSVSAFNWPIIGATTYRTCAMIY